MKRGEVQTAFDPEKELKGLQKEFNKVFDKVNDGISEFWRKKINTGTSPSSDITHETNKVTINFYLHGIDRKNVILLVDDHKVTLEAFLKKKKRTSDGKADKTKRFYREITLPEKLNVEKAKQSWHKGVLTLEIPKRKN